MERHEHVQWAKDRALRYLDDGDVDSAFSSFISDMQKHNVAITQLDTPVLQLGQMHLQNDNEVGMRTWIEGF